MVCMPCDCNFASALGPMPLIFLQLSGHIFSAKSSGCKIEMPLGLFNSLAIFASNLLGATPIEQVSPVASVMDF